MPAKMFNQFICSSLMLPEHREALTRYHREAREKEKARRPSVGEDDREVWDRLLNISLQQGRELIITTEDEEGTCVTRGVVCKINRTRGIISVRSNAAVEHLAVDLIITIG